MKKIRLNFICSLSVALFGAATAGFLFAKGILYPAIIMLILTGISVIILISSAHSLINTLIDLAKAIKMEDFSVRFPKSDCRKLNTFASGINGIIGKYQENTVALETRKLYYDRILRIMTHELRNGITPVEAVSADMENHPNKYTGQQLRDSARLIREQSGEITRFLDSYYNLTHLPAPRLEHISVSTFFNNIRKSFETILSRHGLPSDTISYVIPNDMQIEADPGLLRQVISNLLGNAIYAVSDINNPNIELTVSISEGHPFIEIKDNGCGIPEKSIDFLFQPFFTTKSGGSGIGLCLSRQIARLHGGDLKLTSPRPATFTLLL